MNEENKIIFYQDDDEITRVSVRFADEDLWVTQNQLAEIYCTTEQNISQHIDNKLGDGERDLNRTVKDFFTVWQEGKRQVQRTVLHYNLDMVIALGYRVHPKWLLVSIAGLLSGFMSISKRDLRWMMTG